MIKRGDRTDENRGNQQAGDPFSDGVNPRSIVDDLRERRGRHSAARIGAPPPREPRIVAPPATQTQSPARGRMAQSATQTPAPSKRPVRTSRGRAPTTVTPRRKTHESPRSRQRAFGDTLQPIRIPKDEPMMITEDSPVRVISAEPTKHQSRSYGGGSDAPIRSMQQRLVHGMDQYRADAQDALKSYERQHDAEGAAAYAAASTEAAERYEEHVRRETNKAAQDMAAKAREEAKQSVRDWKASQEVESRASDDPSDVQYYQYPSIPTHQSVETHVGNPNANVPVLTGQGASRPSTKDEKKSGLPMFLIWGLLLFGFFGLNLCDSL